jgi:hypothetical protein
MTTPRRARAEAEMARGARRQVTRRWPSALAEALVALDLASTGVPGPVADRLWSLAALGVAWWRELADAQRHDGRRVIATAFALHATLRGEVPDGAEIEPATRDRLAAFATWLACLAADGPAWRATLTQWTDILCERLTLPRYVDPAHRRRHATMLLARPVALALGAEGLGENDQNRAQAERALEDFAELVLGFWDLLGAQAGRAIGWNRLDLRRGPVAGGFHGLADQASPPDAEAERSTARALRQALATQEAAPLPSPVRTWLAELARRMTVATDAFLADGRWPLSAALPPDAPPSLWRRLLGGA